MHAGVIEKDGGEFKLKIVESVKLFKGVEINNIKSQLKSNLNADFSI